MAAREFHKRLESVAEIVRRIDAVADPSLRNEMRELVEALMSLHGGGVERTLEIISATGGSGQETIDRLGRDEMVGSLLLLYGLHPLNFETRVQHGVEKARTFLKSHRGELEIVSIHDGNVRLRMSASNPQALRESVEELILESTPDVATLVIEGAEPQDFVPVGALMTPTVVLAPTVAPAPTVRERIP